MTATLTIKAEGTGALAVLDRVNTLIDSSVKGSEKLAAITATIRGHWKAIGDDVAAVTRNILGARTETERMAGSAKVMHAGFLSTIGVAQRLASEMRSVRDEAVATARVVNSIRAPGRAAAAVGGTSTTGTGGFSFTPAAPRAPSADRTTPSVAPSVGGGGSSLGSLANLASGPIGAAAGFVTSTIGKALELAWQGFKVGATAAAATAATLVGNSVRLALKAEPISQGFGSLTQSNGLGDQTKVLEDLREAARGTVSDLQLMTNANAALQLGAAKTVPELQLLIEGGRRLGKAMGRDATEGFNDLALGIGRQSKLILDNLGIIVNADQVYEDYAKSVGSTTDKISDQEKKLAFVAAAYDAVQKKMRDLGDEQVTAGEKIEKFKASFSNLSVVLGNRLLPAIGDVADRWASFLGAIDGDKAADGMTKAINAVKGAAGSVLDYIFPEDIAADFGDLGSSIWDAFTNPSEEAFKIIGLQFKKLMSDMGTEFGTFLENTFRFAKLGASGLAHATGAGLKSIGLNSAGQFLQDRALSSAGRTAAAIGGSAADNQSAADGERAKIEAEIAGLRKQAEQRRIERDAERGRLISSGSTPTSGGGSNAAAIAIARAEREAAEAAAKAKADADKAAERALRDEISIREKLIDSMRDEQKLIEETIKDLSGSRENASRALRGEGPAKSLSAELDESAKSLREFPAIFDKIAVDISETGRQITDSISSFQTELDSSFRDISRGLRAQANEFLQQDPQDGESVRVRSLKRRAQRDLRRSNNDLINGAFESVGPGGYGNGSIFGAQNSERSGSVLNQSFPRLESALARLRGPDGSTQIAQIEIQLTGLVSAQASRLEELRAAQAKNFAEQAKATEDQIAATESTRKFVEQATATIGAQAKDLVRLKTTIDKSVAELKKLEQAARTK